MTTQDLIAAWLEENGIKHEKHPLIEVDTNFIGSMIFITGVVVFTSPTKYRLILRFTNSKFKFVAIFTKYHGSKFTESEELHFDIRNPNVLNDLMTLIDELESEKTEVI